MSTTHTKRRRRNRTKALALSAAGVVLVAGITVPSLAAWTDIEWVVGGAENAPGITASSFEVEQFAEGDTIWNHYEEDDGADANVIDFSAQAAQLTPGDTVYGYVRLRTEAGSLGGTLQLRAATTVTPDTLSEALSYGARIVDTVGDCDEDGFAASSTVLRPSGAALSAHGTTGFSLDAAAGPSTPGAEKVVCFAIVFPVSFADDGDLQGGSVSPLWHFDAVSVAAP